MIPFPFNENRFSFFVADHLLVGQLCTNPKSDRSLLSCLKVTQCSTSEIGDAPLYNSCSLPIQVMTTGPLPAPLKCNSGWFNVPRVMKTKFPTTLCSFKWGPHHATSHLRSRLESQHQSVPGCAEVCGAIRWPVADPGCGSRTRHRPTSPIRPKLGFRRSATTLYPSLTAPLLPRPEPAGLLRLVIRREYYQHDLPQHQSQPDRRHPPSSRRRLWKRHVPSSGSGSRRWLRLKAATLNRCQLYYIIKLLELIFSIKVLK